MVSDARADGRQVLYVTYPGGEGTVLGIPAKDGELGIVVQGVLND